MIIVRVCAQCTPVLVGPISCTTVQIHAQCIREVVGPIRDCIVFASAEHVFEYRMPPSQLSRRRAFMTKPLRKNYRNVNSKKKYYIFQNSRNKVPPSRVIVIAWKFKIRLRRKRSDREAKADLKRSGRQERGASRSERSQLKPVGGGCTLCLFFYPKINYVN